MKRKSRCWICGTVFEAERGSLAPGARFTCEACLALGLASQGAEPPARSVLSRALQERHGVPFTDVSELDIEREVLELVPESFARLHALLPIAVRERRLHNPKKPRMRGPPGKELVVAMANPGNVFAREHLERKLGVPVTAVVATWADLQETIGERYLPIAISEEPVPE